MGSEKYKLIENGNYGDSPDHVYLEHGKDAFGNEITPEPGYRLLKPNEKIKKGDKHFDIYGGWTSGGEDYAVRNGHYAGGEGRWRCWERKLVTSEHMGKCM